MTGDLDLEQWQRQTFGTVSTSACTNFVVRGATHPTDLLANIENILLAMWGDYRVVPDRMFISKPAERRLLPVVRQQKAVQAADERRSKILRKRW